MKEQIKWIQKLVKDKEQGSLLVAGDMNVRTKNKEDIYIEYDKKIGRKGRTEA